MPNPSSLLPYPKKQISHKRNPTILKIDHQPPATTTVTALVETALTPVEAVTAPATDKYPKVTSSNH